MLKQRWINATLALLLLGCSTTTELKTTLEVPPAEVLTTKPVLVEPVTPDSEPAADVVRQLLQENGYVIRQNTQVTGTLLQAFGQNQVQPTGDSARLTVRAQVSEPAHAFRKGSRSVSLKSCNYLQERNPCRSRKASLSFVETSVSQAGQLTVTLEEAGRPPRTLTTPFSATTSGVVPALPTHQVMAQMKQALQQLLQPYLKRQEVVSTGIEADRLAVDMMELGLYEAAVERLEGHEADEAVRQYALGYLEERRGNPSGALMYYRDGARLGERQALFDAAIERVERSRDRP